MFSRILPFGDKENHYWYSLKWDTTKSSNGTLPQTTPNRLVGQLTKYSPLIILSHAPFRFSLRKWYQRTFHPTMKFLEKIRKHRGAHNLDDKIGCTWLASYHDLKTITKKSFRILISIVTIVLTKTLEGARLDDNSVGCLRSLWSQFDCEADIYHRRKCARNPLKW